MTDNTQHSNNCATTNSKNLFLVKPYFKVLSERFSKTCRSPVIHIHFTGRNTIHKLLVAPKDKDSTVPNSGVINRYQCTRLEFVKEYIEQSGRPFGDRLKEHLRAPTLIYQHSQTIGHQINVDCFIIIGRRHMVSLGPSRRPCTSWQKTHQSTWTTENTNFHTSGMKSYKTRQHFI